MLRWLRDRIDRHIAEGGDWRGVIDGLRPYTQRLWRELSPISKRRFLEHARAWWDVHRHRMAPELEGRITQAIYKWQLTPLAAKVTRAALEIIAIPDIRNQCRAAGQNRQRAIAGTRRQLTSV
ncbi:hypothetical protein [Bradyrhizobium sp. WSM1743]|uniref:hypothetical protein n=1 Tax=Bradyrhizobium sp. WSM1743 TaxID=318996 RepID=UPI000400D775